jgi:hypothetical protein
LSRSRPGTATITANKGGSRTDIHVGTEHALLHCTTNARRAAADDPAGHPGHTGPMITCTGTVLMSGDPANRQDKVDLTTNWEFGMILVSDLVVYEALYAGRMANEGSIVVNLKSAFGTNPSLDGDGDLPTVDEMIFDPSNQVITDQTTGTKGFLVTYKLGDHPNNPFPLRQTNSKVPAPNFLHTARRDEGFIAYFVARGTRLDGAPSGADRLAHHLAWHAGLDHADRQADRQHGDLAHRYRPADHRCGRQHRLSKIGGHRQEPAAADLQRAGRHCLRQGLRGRCERAGADRVDDAARQSAEQFLCDSVAPAPHSRDCQGLTGLNCAMRPGPGPRPAVRTPAEEAPAQGLP